MKKKNKPKTQTVRVSESIALLARIVASYQAMTLPDYLHSILIPAIRSDIEKFGLVIKDKSAEWLREMAQIEQKLLDDLEFGMRGDEDEEEEPKAKKPKKG